MIKIGQIGIGHNHGAAKMQTLRKFPELFEIVGIAPENDAWLQKRGGLTAYRGLPVLTEDALLAQCDAVLVETEIGRLTETAQKCVDAGKHILMDKPANGTLEQFRKLLDTAKEKQLVVQIGYMYRYNPAVLQLLDWIKDGKLGEIYSIHAEMSACDPDSYRNWLSQFPGAGMFIFGSHLLDLVVRILGKPQNAQSFYTKTDKNGLSMQDQGLAVLTYPKAMARIFSSCVEVNGYGRRQLVVCGSKGTVSILPMERPTLMTYSDLDIATHHHLDHKIEIPVESLSAECRYDLEVQSFYDYVTGKTKNPWTYEHDYAVQETLIQLVGGTYERPAD
ncbi:MAG: Gfo/Idh/MocA family oxidoreductase [Oscillospiraceae bacterium]|nr:Gfo/Idh/MocA family oxidoreductase [Oscillospiraceae bacterium]